MNRDEGIGASEAGMALGVSRFGTRFDLWARKRKVAAEVLETPVMRWGKMLEPLIIRSWAEENGSPRVVGRQREFVDPERPFLYAHVDGLVPRERAILEAKSGWNAGADGWGEPGTDEVPEDYFAQAQHQLHTAGPRWERVIIPALVYRPPLRTYVVKRDQSFIDEVLIPQEVDLWERVLSGDPPTLEGEHAETYLRARFPRGSGIERDATDAEIEAAMAYLAANEDAKTAEARKEAARLALMASMGEAERIVGEGLSVRWSSIKDRASTDWRGIVERLEAPSDLIAEFTAIRPSAPRLTVTFREP